jgi:hypothetical protein
VRAAPPGSARRRVLGMVVAITAVRRWRSRTLTSPTPAPPAARPWAVGRGANGFAARGRHTDREVPHPPHGDGAPSGDRGDRGGSGLHQQMGCSTLGQTITSADFRPGHPASRRGDCDRATWPRIGDQAAAGRTRNGQRTAAGTPPARPDHHPATWVGTAVPAHRHAHDAGRSTGKHSPPAANTVWAAPEQDSLLLTRKER